MNSVVVLHPASDQCKGACGIGYRAYPDVIAFERFDEGLCHAVALRTLDWGKARFEVQGQGDVDGLVGGKDRSVIGQPLHLVRSAAAAEAAFDALDHYIADHLAGDSSGCCQPGDDLAVVAVEDEGHAHDLPFQQVNSKHRQTSGCSSG